MPFSYSSTTISPNANPNENGGPSNYPMQNSNAYYAANPNQNNVNSEFSGMLWSSRSSLSRRGVWCWLYVWRRLRQQFRELPAQQRDLQWEQWLWAWWAHSYVILIDLLFLFVFYSLSVFDFCVMNAFKRIFICLFANLKYEFVLFFYVFILQLFNSIWRYPLYFKTNNIIPLYVVLWPNLK